MQRRTVYILGILGVGLLLWLGFSLRPSACLERQQTKFLRHLESAKWKKAQATMAENYRDEWGFTREEVLSILREMRKRLISLSIVEKSREVKIVDKSAKIRMSFTISASGYGAELYKSHINRLSEPFVFEWQRGKLPWSWKLISVSNSQLRLPDNIKQLIEEAEDYNAYGL